MQIKDIYNLDDFFINFPKASDVKLGLNKKNKVLIKANFNRNNSDETTKNNPNKQHSINNSDNISNVGQIKKKQPYDNTQSQIVCSNNYQQNNNDVIKNYANNKYVGVNSQIIQPNNCKYLKIEDIADIQDIKRDIDDGKYNEFNNIVLKIDDSELLIKVEK